MNIAFSRTLKLSSPLLRGNDVLALQTQLGIPLGQRDGVFGKATQQAVIAYQNRQQLTADGVVGRRTWASLFGTDSITEINTADSTHVDSNAQLVIAEALKQFHNVYPDACKWRLTASGIEIEGKGIETSKGEPKTVSRVCQDYKDALEQAAKKTGVPVELLIATMCTEAFDATMHTVNPRATRKEPGYRSDEATPSRVSYGLTQTLISTARDAISQLAVGAPVSAEKIDREWLFIPANAILAGAAYIAMQKKRTKLDPPVVACAYNAGSVVYNNGANNRWKMRQYPINSDDHADRFVQWFNDCFRYFKDQGCPFDPATSFWQQLNTAATSTAPSPTAQQTASTPPTVTPLNTANTTPKLVFPLRKRPTESYKSGAREFGANRAGGNRKHAGCDLKAPVNTEIFCMADGKVIRGPYYFYEGTYALEVQHQDGMIVRYGEILAKSPKGIKEDAQVKQGQLIAFVGKLNSGNSMLHLEMYSGKGKGQLTQADNPPYKRRSDLINPTQYLDDAVLLDTLSTTIAIETETVDLNTNNTSQEIGTWQQVLLEIPTTGASAITANQDGLQAGIEASQKMADKDLPQVKQYAERFHSAAAKYGIPSALLAAIASRESRCGKVLKDGWGDGGKAFGIMQIDKRYHPVPDPSDPASIAHIEQAADIVCDNLEVLTKKHSDWEKIYLLKGAVTAYNSGTGNIRTIEKMDEGSTGDDYGADVIDRAQFYQQHPELAIFRL